MNHLSKVDENDFIVFLDEKDRKYFDFKEVKDKLNNLMKNNKNINPNPIKLIINSYFCLDMKIIDLPGLTKSNIINLTKYY